MTKLTVNGYIVGKKLGEGSMSEVFLAHDNNGQVVALKVLRQYFKDNQSYIDRIEQEAITLSKISDDRVVRFIEITKTSDDRLVLVFELVDGENLETLIQKDDERPRAIIGTCIISEILLGLEEAHRHGIVHRDLKPENVMLTRSGRIKITDFGVAKNLESQELTVTGIIIGSPAYMSPEQAMGLEVDHRSDLFSLGILLYKLATGKLPFLGNNYQTMVNSIHSGQFIASEKHNHQIHPELTRIIKKSLSKNITARYQKAYEFRYDLMKYLDHIQCPSISNILKGYYDQDESIDAYAPESLIKTIMVRATKAKEAQDQTTSINLVQQILSIDPTNKEAKDLLVNKSYKRPLLSFLLISITFFSSYKLIQKNNTLKTIGIEKVLTPTKKLAKVTRRKTISPVKKIVKRVSYSPKKKVIKKEKRPLPIKRETISSPTKIIFIVDEDVKVYMDGIIVADPKKGLAGIAPGQHEITLVKPGFAPIIGKVDAIKGQTTTINTKSN